MTPSAPTSLTLIVGLACLIQPVPFGARIRPYAWAASISGLVAAAFVLGGVSRLEGGLLVALYLVILAVIWRRERTPPLIGELAEVAARDEDANANRSPTIALAAVVAGVGLMVIGGRLAVAGAEDLVHPLGLADSAVGLTFVALATTAELLALVWAATRHRVADLALAGILGSALYNATATLGAAALIHPVPSTGLIASAWAAALLPLLLLAGACDDTLGRRLGAVLVLGYAAFLVLILTNG